MAFLVAASAAAGALYAVIEQPPESDVLVQVKNGATVGTVISSCTLIFELFLAPRLFTRGGHQVPLVAALLVRTMLFGTVIIAALMIVPWLFSGTQLFPLRPGLVRDIAFSIAATLVFVSLLEMVQLIGPNVLVSLLTGRYHNPREVERIVLFLDIADSTSIAERLGPVRFHAFLAEAFTRVSRVVTDHGGEVYRYVGDALIATWPLGSREANGRAISCLFACQDTLAAARDGFVRHYGEAPAFRASLHAGPLVAGEIGGFKREIALLGDTMNTAARLEQECRIAGHAFLASKPLMDCTTLPTGIRAIGVGSHRLRGKTERLELFALERADGERSKVVGTAIAAGTA